MISATTASDGIPEETETTPPTPAKGARPFLKWAGGKGKLVADILKRLPPTYRHYHEPFVGGGALFFALRPARAFLSDVNEELVTTYQVVRDNLDDLIEHLSHHRYERDYFYEVRGWDRRPDFGSLSPAKRAARFIFLNKTCFNGLYRVNSKGHYNVPFGDYAAPVILDTDNLMRCHQALQGTDISLASYRAVEARAEAGDLVYFDPPYAPVSATSSFTGYTAHGFTDADQQELRDLCVRLDTKGVSFILSNSSAPTILDLYQNFCIERISVARAINATASGRGKVDEVLVRNFVTIHPGV